MEENGALITGLIADVGELKGLVHGINQRLDRLNGAVATSIRELNETKIELALHPVNCPLKVTVDELQRELSSGDHPGSKEVMEALRTFNLSEVVRRETEKVKKNTWWEVWSTAKPFVIAFIMTLFYLIGSHFMELYKLS
jgi:hypothetical protein